MDKKGRTDLFLARLAAATPCDSADAAMAQLADVLNAVESEFTSIPFNPAAWESDGRLYPPQEDKRRDPPGHPNLRRYRSVGHNILVADNGAIRIELVNGGAICLNKLGSDGRSIAQVMDGNASTLSSKASKA